MEKPRETDSLCSQSQMSTATETPVKDDQMRTKPVNLSKEQLRDLTSAILSAFIQYGTDAKIPLAIYAKRCFVTGETPTFKGLMSIIEEKLYIPQIGILFYSSGEDVDYETLDIIVRRTLSSTLEVLQEYPEEANLTKKERKYIKKKGLQLIPISPRNHRQEVSP